MNITSIIILSLTICIDSFLLCILSKSKKKSNYFIMPFIFSLSQTIFLLAGYFLGDLLESTLKEHLKYIVFIILSSMALKLIVDTLINKGKEKTCYYTIKDTAFQAITTSFDSLFLGIPFAFNFSTYLTLLLIVGLTTFIVCFLGLILRNKIKNNYEEKLNLLGAAVLFLFAFKSLI